MGMRENLDHAEVPLETDKSQADHAGQKLQKALHPPDALNRVESLARVCKILAQNTPRSAYETETATEIETGHPSPKKHKDDREKAEIVLTPARRCDMHAVSIGIYTRAERRAKLERYRAKKNRRTFNKKILYACRKSFADSRPRVGGRFVPLKDLPLSGSGSPASPTQRAEQEFSELLASISHDLSQHAETPSGKHSPSYHGHSPPRLEHGSYGGGHPEAYSSGYDSHSPEHSTRHSYHGSRSAGSSPCCNSSASFCPQPSQQSLPLHDYPPQPTFSELGPTHMLPPQYQQQQQHSYYHNFSTSQQQGFSYSRTPNYPFYNATTATSSHSLRNPPSARCSNTPPRGPLPPPYAAMEDPSASLLLLSLASSTASRAEVF